MSDYLTFTIGQIWFFALVPLITAFVYIGFSPDKGVIKRLMPALHSLALVLASLYPLAMTPFVDRPGWVLRIFPFWILLGCFAVGLVLTIRRFRGTRAVHVVQIVQLPAAIYIWLVGTMVITGDWI